MRSFVRWRRWNDDEESTDAPELNPPERDTTPVTASAEPPEESPRRWRPRLPWTFREEATQVNVNDRLWRWMTLLVQAIVFCAFVLGFTALSDIANESRVFPRPWGGPLFAVAVDGFILLGSLAYALAGLRGHARMMIVLGVAASASFQVMHAVFVVGDRVLFSRMTVAVSVALIPPFALLLSVDAWRKLHEKKRAEEDRKRKAGLGLVQHAASTDDELLDLTQFAHLPTHHVDAIALSDLWSRTSQTDPDTHATWTHQALRKKVRDVYGRDVPWQVVKRFIDQQLAVAAASSTNGHHDTERVDVDVS